MLCDIINCVLVTTNALIGLSLVSWHWHWLPIGWWYIWCLKTSETLKVTNCSMSPFPIIDFHSFPFLIIKIVNKIASWLPLVLETKVKLRSLRCESSTTRFAFVALAKHVGVWSLEKLINTRHTIIWFVHNDYQEQDWWLPQKFLDFSIAFTLYRILLAYYQLMPHTSYKMFTLILGCFCQIS